MLIKKFWLDLFSAQQMRITGIVCALLVSFPMVVFAGPSWDATKDQGKTHTKPSTVAQLRQTQRLLSNSKTNLEQQVRELLRQGRALLRRDGPGDCHRGGKMVLQAYQLTPQYFETMVAASEAYFTLSGCTKKRVEIRRFAKAGWDLSQKVIKRWPKRAEGYYWAAANIGMFGSCINIFEAIGHGIAGKIEKMAKASLQHNPRLYKGGAQRILGRFYTMLPWPMRKLSRAVRYLEESYRQSPDDLIGIYFLADAYWKNGQKKKAKEFFLRCAHFKVGSSLGDRKTQRDCLTWVKKHASR